MKVPRATATLPRHAVMTGVAEIQYEPPQEVAIKARLLVFAAVGLFSRVAFGQIALERDPTRSTKH